MQSIELFTGAGGLALGLAKSGFSHDLAVEFNPHACATIRSNQAHGHSLVRDWNLVEADVRGISFKEFEGKIELLAGGPPCQPFSMGGKHRGQSDNRNMFPEVFRAVRETQPKAVLIENVKGLTRKAFTKYVSYLRLQLTHPELRIKSTETWEEHLSRIERHHTQGRSRGLQYNVVFQLVNAADYGIPQRRERVFFVAIRSDLGLEWSFPQATHSEAELLFTQWVSET